METILFTLGGKPVLLLDLLSAVLGLTCVVLAGRNSRYNFWVGYLYTAALFLLFWHRNLYASLLLQPISLSINIVGHYRWTHPRPGEESAADAGALKVTMLSGAQRWLAATSVLIVAGLWGWILATHSPSDPHPYLDACVTVMILLAQLLSALKKWDCWVVWLLVNITQTVLHLLVGNVFMAGVSVLYLANGIWSLATWKKLYGKNE